LVPFLRFVSTQLRGPHGLVLSTVGPYIDRCGFPNHFQSI
jgi:hypothetical protein